MPTIVHSKSVRSEEDSPAYRLHSLDRACIYRAFTEERGYYLNVLINLNGKLYQKYFPEKRCGGQENTMRLALA